jgi:acetyl-CoA carboxylase carboxyltransferase component
MDVVESQARPDTAESRQRRAHDGPGRDPRRLDARRGGPAAHARHREQGKLPVRELVTAARPGLPFSRSAPRRGRLYDGEAPGAGLTRHRPRGRRGAIVANDATVKGGTAIRSR